ncbi:MAG TPA: hypothetical protein VFT22_17665 [Kofleriaceae bacterium]|nr:hypothetical protein [Kofleriaceae bacterium]
MGTEAVRFLVLWMAGWINSRQVEVIVLSDNYISPTTTTRSPQISAA